MHGASPALQSIREEIVGCRLPVGYEDVRDTYDSEKAELYLHLYTLPVLEAADLLKDERHDEAVKWGKAQLDLCLHIRYLDDVLDGDCTRLSVAETLRRSHAYLRHAHALFASTGASWDEGDEAVYLQFLLYEDEAACGAVLDFDTMWRRVSPLCIVAETRLRDLMPLEFGREYRAFLAWSLAHADCADALEDLKRGRETVVVSAARELAGRSGAIRPEHLAGAVRHVRDLLACRRPRPAYPLWAHIVDSLERSFLD
jgi:hypothetical protein